MILNLYNAKLNFFQDKYILNDKANCLDFLFFVHIGSEQFLLTIKNIPRYIILRAVIQRVKRSSVTVNGDIIGKIGSGLLVLLGVSQEDEIKDAHYLVEKIPNLRIFEDENAKMNRSLLETGGEMLVVSQFTLLGDCRKGRRPSFTNAAGPNKAKELYNYFVSQVKLRGVKVKTGQFRAVMSVSLINDGPVTLIVESQ